MNFCNYLLNAIIISMLLLGVDARNLTRCELVDELRTHGFPEDDMKNWVCLVEQESARQTDVVSKPNKNGSRDHGLFQINDNIWCSNTTTPGKLCNVTCAELTNDDIAAASVCAKTIFARQGWLAWHGWEKRCQSNLPDIANCTQTTTMKADV